MLAVLVGLTSRPGQDHGQYMAWSSAALSGNIEELDDPAAPRSPVGLPVTQWLAGPGLLIAPFMAAATPLGWRESAGVIAGFVCALMFWSCFFTGMRDLAGRHLAVLGCAVAFVATPLGYYSVIVSSETYSLLPAGVLFLYCVALARRAPASLLGIGAATGMLLMLRPYLAVYAWPALGVALRDEFARGKVPGIRCLLILGVPIALALLQVGTVNYWMTGNVLRSPYQFGDAQFQSLDWKCPYLGNVLGDPLHGLFPSHPLMGVGFVLIGWLAAASFYERRYREALLWGLSAVAIGINAYVQGCWYCWWLADGCFGMRGMLLASIPAMAAFLRGLSMLSTTFSGRKRPPSLRIILAGVAGGCAAWSWLLMADWPPKDHPGWGQLLTAQVAQIGQWFAFKKDAVLLFSGALAALALQTHLRCRWRDGAWPWLAWLAATLATAYLLSRLFLFLPQPPLLHLYAALAIGAAVCAAGSLGILRIPVASLSVWAVAGLLGVMLAAFLPLVIHTQPVAATQIDSPPDFDERHLVAAYMDLVDVPRLQGQKNHIGDFLRRRKGDAWYETFQKSAGGDYVAEPTSRF